MFDSMTVGTTFPHNKAVYTSQSLRKGLNLLEFNRIYFTDPRTDGQTDGRMEKASYRVAFCN